jgi:hypothetical protein
MDYLTNNLQVFADNLFPAVFEMWVFMELNIAWPVGWYKLTRLNSIIAEY